MARSGTDWKAENRVLTLVKMGFHREEAEAALTGGSSGDIMGHDTLSRLLEPFRSSSATPTARLRPSSDVDGGSRHRSGERPSENPSRSITVDSVPAFARDEEVGVVKGGGYVLAIEMKRFAAIEGDVIDNRGCGCKQSQPLWCYFTSGKSGAAFIRPPPLPSSTHRLSSHVVT